MATGGYEEDPGYKGGGGGWKGNGKDWKGKGEDWKGKGEGGWKGKDWKGKAGDGDWKGKGKADWKGKAGDDWKGKGEGWKGKEDGREKGKGKGKGKKGTGKKGGGPDPSTLPEGVQLETFAVHVAPDGQTVHLDVYSPTTANNAAGPSVLYTHGSAFGGGPRLRNQPPYLEAFAKRGYTMAVVEHRGARGGFPGMLHDGKAALRFLRSNAGPLGLDPQRISVFGNSSGGWMSLMLAATAKTSVASEVDLNGKLGVPAFRDAPLDVACCVDFYGPTNFLLMDGQRPEGAELTHDEAYSPESKLMGYPIQEKPEETMKACPVTYVDASMPPTLVMHGTADDKVPFGQSKHIVEKFAELGVKHKFHELPGAGHGGDEFMSEEVTEMVLSWLDEHSPSK